VNLEGLVCKRVRRAGVLLFFVTIDPKHGASLPRVRVLVEARVTANGWHFDCVVARVRTDERACCSIQLARLIIRLNKRLIIDLSHEMALSLTITVFRTFLAFPCKLYITYGG
jgi:hypothetical protein